MTRAPQEGTHRLVVVREPTTSTMAVLSAVMGVVSWFICPFVGALIAILLGHAARNDLKHSNDRGGGLATLGMVLGYAHLLIYTLIALVVVLVVLGFGATLFGAQHGSTSSPHYIPGASSEPQPPTNTTDPRSSAPAVIGDAMPYPPKNPGTTFVCVTAPTTPMYRVNECPSHAAIIGRHFEPFLHAGQSVCYSVELDGALSDGTRTLSFTCDWKPVPQGA